MFSGPTDESSSGTSYLFSDYYPTGAWPAVSAFIVQLNRSCEPEQLTFDLTALKR